MSEQNNRHVVEQAFAALNGHDVDTYLKLLDDSFVSESELSGPISGPDGVRKMLQMYLTAFPDLHFEIEQIITSGDHVISRYRAQARTRVIFSESRRRIPALPFRAVPWAR
jgi:predicted ester cyclase